MSTVELFFLDDAAPDAVRSAAKSGIVAGVTTNPSILRACAPDDDPIDVLRNILTLLPVGPVFHQIHAGDVEAGGAQVEALRGRLEEPDRLVFKLPAQSAWFAFGADLVERGHRVAYTAVYQPGQYLAAAQVGASYVIPYVDRTRRLRPDAGDVVETLARYRRPAGSAAPAIVAASVKSAAQGLEAFARGADAITAPWSVLHELMHDELTDSAVEQFRADVPW